MSERTPRRDAARNRALLVEAAVTAFRDEGLGASVNEIAARAGVNVATLYRHFPAKDDLLAAVLDRVLEPLEVARDRALAAAGAGTVLGTFLREAVRMQQEHRGLIEALAAAPTGGDVRRRLREPALAIVAPLAELAHRDGELRPDLDATDLLVALRMVSIVAHAGAPAGREADRYVDVVVRGLRPG
jgi:AcrR family transcriptional regulator